MKTLLLIFCPMLALAAGDYETISCWQKCGLTPQTPDSVYARGMDSYSVDGMLSDACRWKGMELQGNANCTKSVVQPSKTENGMRCIKGINTYGNCMAAVDGRGDVDKGSYRTFQKWGNSFDESIDAASKACHDYYSNAGTYSYRCDLAGYWAY